MSIKSDNVIFFFVKHNIAKLHMPHALGMRIIWPKARNKLDVIFYKWQLEL